MWVWLLMLLSIVAFWVLIPDALGKKKKNLIFLGLCFIAVVFIMGSRSPHMMNSSDLMSYYRMFYRSTYMTLSELAAKYDTIEQGFLVLLKIVSTISPWAYTFQYLEAAFCTFVMFWYIYRNTDSVFLGVLIYICFGPWQFFLTGFRQAFAISLCYISLELLKKHKLKCDIIGVCLIALAATLHSTAWVFVAVLMLRNLKMSKRLVVIFSAVTVVMLGLLPYIIELGNDLFNKDHDMEYFGNALGGLIPIVVYTAALILTYFAWNEDKSCLSDYGVEVTMLLVGLCLYTLRYSSLIMERVSFYFTPVIGVVLANGITRQKNKLVKNICCAVLIVLLIALYIYRSMEQYGTYNFFWNYLELLDLYVN